MLNFIDLTVHPKKPNNMRSDVQHRIQSPTEPPEQLFSMCSFYVEVAT